MPYPVETPTFCNFAIISSGFGRLFAMGILRFPNHSGRPLTWRRTTGAGDPCFAAGGWASFLKAYVIVALGGLGNIKGYFVGAFFLSVLEAFVISISAQAGPCQPDRRQLHPPYLFAGVHLVHRNCQLGSDPGLCGDLQLRVAGVLYLWRLWLGYVVDLFRADAAARICRFAAVAGGVYAGVVTPRVLVTECFLVAMVTLAVGGMGQFPGAVLGVFIVVIGYELLRCFDDYRLLLLGVAVVLTVIFLSQGVAEFFRKRS